MYGLAPLETAEADRLAVAFIRRFKPAIEWAIMRERVPLKDRKDVFQDVCIRILQRFRKEPLAPEYQLTYATTTAINISRNHNTRTVSKHKGVNVEFDILPTCFDHDPLDKLIRMEAHERLHACIELLPRTDREVMQLTLMGLENWEIAKELGITMIAAKVRTCRARIRLRSMLTQKELR